MRLYALDSVSVREYINLLHKGRSTSSVFYALYPRLVGGFVRIRTIGYSEISLGFFNETRS